jgi:hypothetical protein
MEILARTYPNQSPYRVSDNGTDIFFCNYKHEAEAFIRGVKYANRKRVQLDLWTNYEERFEIKEDGENFLIWDYATGMTLGGHEFKSELEAEVFKREFIEYEKEQERYYNQSGR